jgi:hypothetical protein
MVNTISAQVSVPTLLQNGAETRLRGLHRAAGVTGAGSGIIFISVGVATYGTKP